MLDIPEGHLVLKTEEDLSSGYEAIVHTRQERPIWSTFSVTVSLKINPRSPKLDTGKILPKVTLY